MKEKVLTIIVSSALAIVILLASITTLALQPSMINTSYNEYLSVERPISRFYTIDLGFVFYIDEESGYLYKLDLETDESTLLLETAVKENIEYGDRVYCILQNNKIVSLKYDGSDLQNHYQGNAEVKTLWTDGEALFFQHGNSICRYHIPSKILDTLVTSNYISNFKPITNLEIAWSEYTIEWLKYYHSEEYDPDAFAMYGMYPGFGSEITTTKIYDDETNSIYNSSYKLSSLNTSSYNNSVYSTPTSVIINNKTVPLNEYPVGNFFSDSKEEECTCNPHSASVCPFTGTCGCEFGYNPSYGKCIMCVGFAYTAYREIWDIEGTNFPSRENDFSFSNNSWGIYQLGMFFGETSVGSVMLPQDRGGEYGRDQHAFVLTKVTSDGIWIYHANVNSKCDIQHDYKSYEELAEVYGMMAWIYEAP
ncbi:MAG: hypothetical protein IJE51_03070 [Clostridia bacterium]|nr:hypothetical protein [Clostridia bacterium]